MDYLIERIHQSSSSLAVHLEHQRDTPSKTMNDTCSICCGYIDYEFEVMFIFTERPEWHDRQRSAHRNIPEFVFQDPVAVGYIFYVQYAT